MAMPRNGLRKLVVDGQTYFVSLSGKRLDAAGNVPISFVAHLEGNDATKLVVKGITSRRFWHDYPNAEQFVDGVFRVTPRIAVTIIRHGISQGWDPKGKGQTTVELRNGELQAMLDTES